MHTLRHIPLPSAHFQPRGSAVIQGGPLGHKKSPLPTPNLCANAEFPQEWCIEERRHIEVRQRLQAQQEVMI